VAHWDSRPCGADAGSAAEEGSAEFFRLIDLDRYQRYAPWLPGVARFERFDGQDLLEIGCGLGTDLARFAMAGARVTGIDLVPRHLALTRRRFELARLRACLTLADVERLPYPDESFDAVYSFGVLHHTPDDRAALSEIRRVLRPGGRVIIAVYHRRSYNLAIFLAREVVRGHLFREPFAVTLGRMEGVGATALVRLESPAELRRKLVGFADVRVGIHHLQRWPLRFMKRWAERRLGWYIWAEGHRPY